MSETISLRLLPNWTCLYDEPVQVKVSGLGSRQVVTVRARSTDGRGVAFTSSSTYEADSNGDIDLHRDPSLSGSYVGVEPMGLLWSLKAEASNKMFHKKSAESPFVVVFSVHGEEGGTLAEATNQRVLIGEGVSRVPVNEGNVFGVLFTPPGDGPFPAVLDLSTYMCEKRASLLANKGFVVLTVPVFTLQSKNLKELHLDPFEEAVSFLKRLPKVGSQGVALISRSKAADVALSLAAFVPGVEAVVWINGCSANTALPLYFKKKLILSALKVDINKVFSTPSGTVIFKYAMHDPTEEESRAAVVPIERATCQFLFVASEDDLNWNSRAYMEEMAQRLKHHGKENFECVSYPRAGHYLEPPYGPYCPSSINSVLGKPSLWGGEPRAHAAAEVHLWRKIQEFLRAHLSTDAAQTKSKL